MKGPTFIELVTVALYWTMCALGGWWAGSIYEEWWGRFHGEGKP